MPASKLYNITTIMMMMLRTIVMMMMMLMVMMTMIMVMMMMTMMMMMMMIMIKTNFCIGSWIFKKNTRPSQKHKNGKQVYTICTFGSHTQEHQANLIPTKTTTLKLKLFHESSCWSQQT